MARSLLNRAKQISIAAVLLISLLSPAFAGLTHSEGGPVGNASDGTSALNGPFRVYEQNRAVLAVTDTVAYFPSAIPAGNYWLGDVGSALPVDGTRPIGYLTGDDHMAIVDQEKNTGTPTHRGYYAVINKNISPDDPDQFPGSSLREIPVPVAVAGDSQVALSWAAAAEDHGSPEVTNIVGYNVLRGTNPAGPFAIIGTAEGITTYTDNTAANGITYYYVINIIYRITSGIRPTSQYTSANSNAVTPSSTVALLSITPNSGNQGQTVNVTVVGSGTHFDGSSVLSFNSPTGLAISNVQVSDATHLTATITIDGAAATGARDVTVATGGEVATLTGGFTINAAPVPPTVTSVTPSTGINTSATVVTIEGTNFTGTTAVRIGGTNVLLYTEISPTRITATIQSGLTEGIYHITVTTPNGTSASTAADLFSVTSSGSGSLVVDDYETHAGKHALGDMNDYYISGSNPGEVTLEALANSADRPEGARSLMVKYLGSVSGQWGGYYGGDLTTQVKDLRTANGISFLVKGDGSNNSLRIDLKESTVGGVTGETWSSPTYATLNDTSWHVISIPFNSFTRSSIPPAYTGAGSDGIFSRIISGYTILYTGSNANSNVHYIDYIRGINFPVPTVTNVTPNTSSDAYATPVTITGTNLLGATSVKIGGVNVTSFTVDSATQIRATIQAHLAAATYHITVTTSADTSATSPLDQFTVTSSGIPSILPTVTNVTPNIGSNATTTTIVITGTNLNGATAVYIGTTGISFTPPTGSTQITAVVPAYLAAGTYHITVTTPLGTSTTSVNDEFTVTGTSVSAGAPPVISNVTFAGKTVFEGDITSPTPLIVATITDADGNLDPSKTRITAGSSTYSSGTTPMVDYDPATGRTSIAVPGPLPTGLVTFVITAEDTTGLTDEYVMTLRVTDGSLYIEGNVFNYKNPFDPIHETTMIAFNLSIDSPVQIYIFDSTARILVKRIVNATAGFNEVLWDGRDDYGEIVSNGVYLCRVTAGDRLIGKTKIWAIKK